MALVDRQTDPLAWFLRPSTVHIRFYRPLRFFTLATLESFGGLPYSISTLAKDLAGFVCLMPNHGVARHQKARRSYNSRLTQPAASGAVAARWSLRASPSVFLDLYHGEIRSRRRASPNEVMTFRPVYTENLHAVMVYATISPSDGRPTRARPAAGLWSRDQAENPGNDLCPRNSSRSVAGVGFAPAPELNRFWPGLGANERVAEG